VPPQPVKDPPNLLAAEEGQFRLEDSQRNVVMAPKRIASRLTICRGRRLTAPL
jgi:hypothetical protein